MTPIIDRYRIFSRSQDGAGKLTTNFVAKEFACQDGSETIVVNELVPVVCQIVRNWFGYSFTPNSAYRTVAHNKNVGGASRSNHIYGLAVDIPAKSGKCTPRELYNFLDKLFSDSCEIGLYNWGVHFAATKEKSRFTDSTYKGG